MFNNYLKIKRWYVELRYYLKDLLIDKKFGIKTEIKRNIRILKIDKSVVNNHAGDSTFYAPSPYDDVLYLAKKIETSENDEILDIGCGMGRVVFALAANTSVSRIDGVDCSETLIEISKTNLSKTKIPITKPINFYVDDILDFNLDRYTIFFLFNPFGIDTLQSFLNRLYASITKNPREIKIIYYFCTKERRDVFKTIEWLNFDDVIRCRKFNALVWKSNLIRNIN